MNFGRFFLPRCGARIQSDFEGRWCDWFAVISACCQDKIIEINSLGGTASACDNHVVAIDTSNRAEQELVRSLRRRPSHLPEKVRIAKKPQNTRCILKILSLVDEHDS